MRLTVPIATRPAASVRNFLGALVVPLVLLGCEGIVNQRGFTPTPGSLDKLEVGTQSREDVVRLIGSPSAVATFNPNVWYYISERQEAVAFFKPKVTEQNVMQLSFTEAGRLQTIKKYDQKDAESITMVSRITPTAGKQLTILEQILGNIGKFAVPKSGGGGNPGAPTSGGGANR
jgi:outer membrane protein assembly factor BamE (lipoprotein component of BamABCDE complex)